MLARLVDLIGKYEIGALILGLHDECDLAPLGAWVLLASVVAVMSVISVPLNNPFMAHKTGMPAWRLPLRLLIYMFTFFAVRWTLLQVRRRVRFSTTTK